MGGWASLERRRGGGGGTQQCRGERELTGGEDTVCYRPIVVVTAGCLSMERMNGTVEWDVGGVDGGDVIKNWGFTGAGARSRRIAPLKNVYK